MLLVEAERMPFRSVRVQGLVYSLTTTAWMLIVARDYLSGIAL